MIVPFMFDQDQWAARVTEMQLGPSPMDREVLFPPLTATSESGNSSDFDFDSVSVLFLCS